MKLKKIASLMLAGIMAVSMLAACGSAPVEEDPSSSETPATGVSATFASYLKNGKRVEFADDDTYQGYLSAGLDAADPKWDDMNAIKSVQSAKDWGVYNEVVKKIDANEVDFKNRATIENFSKVTNAEDETFVSMYAAPGKLSQNVVLKGVAEALDQYLADGVLVNYYENNGTRYDYDYTGSVSMQKVEDGSASAWYVLVTVTIDATEVKA